MPKNKRPVPRKTAPPEDKSETTIQTLAFLALELSEREDGEAQKAVLRQQEEEFHKLLRKTLNQQKDEVLYEAIERARDEDVGAYQFLREAVAEAAATLLVRRDNAPEMEINAFAIPLFVRSTGGLKQEQEFQDQEAYDALLASFHTAQLEAPKARVVLIQHAYDLNEIDAVTYSHLHEMVREAYASMTDKKIVAAPALERSMPGWTDTGFAPSDEVTELRFLLGFALKRADDPFYRVPAEEAAADAYFAARMERYQQWTTQAAALVKRCLATQPVELNFLYQDLFYGAKEQGMAEYAMLQMMAEVNQALQQQGLAAEAVKAVVAPADVRGAMVLRTSLYPLGGGAILVSSEKPLDLSADLEVEVDDVCDALETVGVRTVAVAQRFDAQGAPVGELPYRPA
jgi:hypothetical protein